MKQDQIIGLVNQLVSADNPNTVNNIYGQLIKQAQLQNISLQTIYPVYKKIASQKLTGFTVPAINLRTLTFDSAKIIFNIAQKNKSPLFLFEIAPSEQEYTAQSPAEFTSYILAAAILENYQYPIFIQGDHYQVNVLSFQKDRSSEIAKIKKLIKDSIDAGFYNIDIDASTLVDYSHQLIDDQQQNNSQTTAELIQYIREVQPENININIGGEIGHIGGTNSTEQETNVFLSQLNSYLGTTDSISKLSIQTGTRHGGQVDEKGNIKLMSVDFELIKTLGNLVKQRYNLAGVVQHGASTLPENLFSKFVEAGTLEIHLATEFQNIVFDHLPNLLKQKMYSYLFNQYPRDWNNQWTEAQFIYKTRKKTLGKFKRELLIMTNDEKQPILENLKNTIKIIFDKLNIGNSEYMIKEIY